MSDRPPACDRCGACDGDVPLIAWTLPPGERPKEAAGSAVPRHDALYLCPGCVRTIVLGWLLEHRQLIVTNREKRTQQPKGQAPQGRARGP